MSMFALVITGAGRAGVRSVPVPEPGPGRLRIRMEGSGFMKAPVIP